MSTNPRPLAPEEVESAAPWLPPDVTPAPTSTPAIRTRIVEEKLSRPPPRMTVGALESMQNQAYAEACEQGKGEGYRAGFEEGRQAGHAEGRQAGLEEGRKQGFDQGREEGMAAAREEQAALARARLERLDALLRALSEPLAQLDETIEQELVALAMAVARQLVRREIRVNPGQIVAVVRDAVSALPSNARQIALHVHPDDAPLLREAFALDDDSAPLWRLVEDPLISPGGCRVLTEQSSIDATVEKRLAQVIAVALGDQRSDES
ncbi:MAG TPA: flagellar assembly protein FliH [Methylococcaceae bacterium]|nr:flagellar assembly protein FliH [Methylococcaceae bacterium]